MQPAKNESTKAERVKKKSNEFFFESALQLPNLDDALVIPRFQEKIPYNNKMKRK